MVTKEKKEEMVKNWKCADGRILLVSEMENSHIIRAIEVCRRNGFISTKNLGTFFSKGPQGDAAQLAFEQAQNEAFSKAPLLALDWLEEEADKRGLSY